ncbi:MAG: hypothetical protein J6S85_18370 [Methanobrevibacter sp.]|nr:hypothetical protein [Methanobrevibacter sp.]
MRRAKSKVEIAYYKGMRIGISTAIEAFYEQNGFNSSTFNMCASMRKEFIRAESLENQCRHNLYVSTNHHNLKQEEN